MLRTFVVIPNKIFSNDDSPDISGLIESDKIYEGHNPMQASKKVFTRIANLSKSQECSYIFMIKETTIGKTHNKIFTYMGTKKKLENPIDVSKGKSYFQVNYKSDIRAYKKDITCDKMNEENEKDISQILEMHEQIQLNQDLLDKIPKEPEWFPIEKKIIPSY